MSRIGTLEQFGLANVLQRIEVYSKTGLLVFKHDTQWVELYFRNGRLMCIGPVPADMTPGDRLLQAGIISPQILHETLRISGTPQPGETRMAVILLELGYINNEDLRAWSYQEALALLQHLLTWKTGEIYFEEDILPTDDRLQVALSAISLLNSIVSAPVVPPSLQPQLMSAPAQIAPLTPQPVRTQMMPPTPQPVRPDVAPPYLPSKQYYAPSMQQPKPSSSAPTAPIPTAPAPVQVNASQLLADVAMPMPSTPSFADISVSSSFSASDSSASGVSLFGESASSTSDSTLSPPVRVMNPQPPQRIDTRFMRPDMVLVPVDMSPLRRHNPQIQITPEQWRLLTRVDGQTSLEMICQALAMPVAMVCQIVGELIAAGFVQIAPNVQAPVNELSPVSQDMLTAGLSNGYVTPGYAASPVQSWSAMAPTTDPLPQQFVQPPSYETVSQWGNGGNGAAFVPGQGWVTHSQPLQSLPPNGQSYSSWNGIYIQAGVDR